METDNVNSSILVGNLKTEPDLSDGLNALDLQEVASVASPFEKLPTELMRMIIRRAIPQGLRFSFQRGHSSRKGWNVLTQRMDTKAGFSTVLCGKPSFRPTPAALRVQTELATYTSLLRVNACRDETQATFFNGNEFIFHITASGRNYDPFGPFTVDKKQHILREMRSIRLILDLKDCEYGAADQLRRQVQQLVSILTKYKRCKSKRSLLKHLTLSMGGVCYDREVEGTYMFACEILCELRALGTIQEVNVTGIPPWYAQCLETYIAGKGGDLSKSPRPVKKTQHRYDWKEYAERNGIVLPSDFSKIWKVVN